MSRIGITAAIAMLPLAAAAGVTVIHEEPISDAPPAGIALPDAEVPKPKPLAAAADTARSLRDAQYLWSIGKRDEALAVLPVPGQGLTDEESASVEFTRAMYLSGIGKLAAAVQAMTNRQLFLRADDASQNASRIWELLMREPVTANAVRAARDLDPVTQGWLDLAAIAQMGAPAGEHLTLMGQWAEVYAPHPAANHALTLRPSQTPLVPHPVRPRALNLARHFDARPAARLIGSAAPLHIGALLPLSGPYSGAGQSVLTGLRTALEDLPSITGSPVRISWFDTAGDSTRIGPLLDQASDAGVNVIVGPMTKAEMPSAIEISRDIPVVALNFPAIVDADEAPAGAAATFVAMGLSPADDAAAAAAHAARAGIQRVLLLRSADEWGQTSAAAFESAARDVGLDVLKTVVLPKKYEATSTTIRDAMGAAFDGGSSARSRHIVPYADDRIDAVFVAAKPAAAGTAVPLLRYWGATRVPIYVTQGNPQGNNRNDLQTVWVCSAPRQPALQPPRLEATAVTASPPDSDDVASAVPEHRTDTLLSVLGADAAAVAAAMLSGLLVEGWRGAGGNLTLNGSVIRRASNCARAAATDKTAALDSFQ